MASNLDCVGLGVTNREDLERLVNGALAEAELLAEVDGAMVLRWQDPSGARMVINVRDRDVLDLVPSYAGHPGAHLANVRAVNEEVAVADVVDEDGEQLTVLAVELEQRRLLALATGPVGGPACVVALGVDVTVHADADAFAASDASLLVEAGADDPPAGDPPDHVVERGLSWPPRMAAESVISYGVFGAQDARAYARLHGTVLHAQRHTVAATGQSFVAARVRTTGFEVDLCLPATEVTSAVQPGNVVGGTVFLVASLDGLTPDT
jgi:hypothetical protein